MTTKYQFLHAKKKKPATATTKKLTYLIFSAKHVRDPRHEMTSRLLEVAPNSRQNLGSQAWRVAVTPALQTLR